MRAQLVRTARHIGPGVQPQEWEMFGWALGSLAGSRWAEVAWKASRLTRDGTPVEFAFSSRDDRLRCTLDPAPPELAARDRLDATLALAVAFGQTSSVKAVAPWRRAIGATDTRWGGWLGLRQRGRRLCPKIYVEAGLALADKAPDLGTGQLKMVGLDLSSGLTEYYYSLPGLDPIGLDRLLERTGATQAAAQRALLETCWGLPLRFGLRWITLGCSISFDGARMLPGAALHFQAHAARGASETVHAAMLAEQEAHGLRASAYRRLWRDRPLADHGVVTIGEHRDGGLDLRCGISGRAAMEAAGDA